MRSDLRRIGGSLAIWVPTLALTALTACKSSSSGDDDTATPPFQPAVGMFISVQPETSYRAGQDLGIAIELRDSNGDLTADQNVEVFASLVLNGNDPLTELQGTLSRKIDPDEDDSILFTDLNLTMAGSQFNLVFSADGFTPVTTAPFDIVGGLADSMTLGGIDNPAGAGDPVSVLVEIYDEFGNLATDYTGTVQFSSNDPLAILPADYTFTGADAGQHLFSGILLGTLTTDLGVDNSITVSDPLRPSVNNTITTTVIPGSFDHFTFNFSGPQGKNLPFSGTATISAVDFFDNVIPVFDASADNVKLTSTPAGIISGLGGSGDTLDQAGDFVAGVADVTGLLTLDPTSGNGPYTITATGQSSGNSATSDPVDMVGEPVVNRFARFRDIGTTNGEIDPGDEIILPFDVDIQIGAPAETDIDLGVTGDDLGGGSSFGVTAAGDGLQITLAEASIDAVLRTRGLFDASAVTANSPSGIDVAAVLGADAIESSDFPQFDALQKVPPYIDLIPDLVSNQNFSNANDSLALAVGDLDRDGDLDLAEATASGWQMHLNNGSGTYSTSGGLQGSESFASISIGDLDADGDLDVVAGDNIFLSDGMTPPAFTETDLLLTANASALGDLDGDGDLDLVIGSDAVTQVLVNDGSGVFTDAGIGVPDTANQTRALALVDLDGDSKLDIIEGNTAGEANQIWNNTTVAGVLSFTAGQAFGSGITESLAVADLDADGDLDVVSGNNGEANKVWLNSAGALADSGQALGNSATGAVLLVDIDGDSRPDLFEGVLGSTSNQVWMNDGSGSFTDSGMVLGLFSTSGLVAADIEGDGDQDVLTANAATENNKVWRNSLTGSWGTSTLNDSGQSIGSLLSFGSTTGDVNGDGYVDVIVGSFDNSGSTGDAVLLNDADGTGNFTDSLQALGSARTVHLRLGDIDQDGDLDLVASRSLDFGVDVYKNDGLGNFSAFGGVIGTRTTVGVALADVNNDGSLDLITANGGQANEVFTNDGNGNFTNTNQDLGTNEFSSCVAAGDLNGNGLIDLVFGNLNLAQPQQVYLNNGDGTWTAGDTFDSFQEPIDIQLADFDGDGDLDVVYSDFTGANIGAQVWINDGAAVFSAGQLLTPPAGTVRGVGVADFDGNGTMDIYLGIGAGNPALSFNRVYLNDGSATFTDTGLLLGPVTVLSSVAIGDFDRDGDPDVFAPDSNGGGDLIFLNQ